jgi:hypothetical protein
MRKILPLTIGMLLTITGPSNAADEQNSDTIGDVRCVVVGLKIAQLPDATQKAAGVMVTLYYIGRLDGRTPNLAMEDLISQEAQNITSASFQVEAARCGNSLKARGQALTEMGEHLTKRAQATQPQPSP